MGRRPWAFACLVGSIFLFGIVSFIILMVILLHQPSSRPSSEASCAVRGFKVTDEDAIVRFKKYSFGKYMTFPTTPPFRVKAADFKPLEDLYIREQAFFFLLKGIIQSYNEEKGPSTRPPLVVDCGANHGAYALYAATLGAEALAVEPQKDLVGKIIHSIQENGLTKQVTLFHHAILDARQMVRIRYGDFSNDGGLATIALGGDICAIQVDDIITSKTLFLKVDVEGSELKALASARKAFQNQLVRYVLTEFGPPQRWADVTNQSADDGVRSLTTMHDFGFIAWLAPSQCTSSFVKLGARPTGEMFGVKLIKLLPSQFRMLVDMMKTTGRECYILWALDSVTSKP